MNIKEDKELEILKSGEKILQKDKNILIKEAENKYKEKQKLKKDEKKSKLKNQNKTEVNEEINKSIDNTPTYSIKKSTIYGSPNLVINICPIEFCIALPSASPV